MMIKKSSITSSTGSYNQKLWRDSLWKAQVCARNRRLNADSRSSYVVRSELAWRALSHLLVALHSNFNATQLQGASVGRRHAAWRVQHMTCFGVEGMQCGERDLNKHSSQMSNQICNHVAAVDWWIKKSSAKTDRLSQNLAILLQTNCLRFIVSSFILLLDHVARRVGGSSRSVLLNTSFFFSLYYCVCFYAVKCI